MRLVLGFLACFWAQVGVAQEALVSLERLDQVRNWRAVGLLEIGGRGTCTGTLIEADLVLTAAHCLVDDRGRPYPAEDIQFRAAFQHGSQVAQSWGRELAIPADYDPGGDQIENGFAVDVGLLRLNTRLLGTQVRPLRVVDLIHRDRELAVVSYGQGRNDAPSLQPSCNLLQRHEGMLVMDCASTFGSSGAPVFVVRDGGPRIVGVVAGGFMDGDVPYTVGVPVDGFLSGLRQQLNGLSGQIGSRTGASVTILNVGEQTETGARFVTVE
jgi:protease YdgD